MNRGISNTVCATLLVTGCSADLEKGYVERDSSAVAIVENRGVTGRRSPITIDTVPSFTIGDSPDNTSLQFHQIRGMTRLPSGEIVVADASAREIRYFSLAGDHLNTIGGAGDGPGKFRSISRLWRTVEGQVVVYDDVLSRVTQLTRSGAVERTTSTAGHERRPIILGALNDSVLIGYWRVPFSPEARAGGVSRDTVFIRTFAVGDGRALGDSIGPLAASEYVIVPRKNGMSVASRPFGRTLLVATRGDEVAVGVQDTFVIDIFSRRGRLLRSIRLSKSKVAINKTDIERYRREWIGDIREPAQAGFNLQLMEATTYPSAWPAHGAIEFDELGWLWVRRPTTYRDDQPEWEVFDSQGVWRGSVEVPEGFGVFEIGRDYILGRWKNRDEVEHVRIYPLRREPSSE